MEDAVTRYCAASAANDIDALLETLAPEAELVSPLSAGLVFRGKDDLRVLLGAIYGATKGLEWRKQIANGSTVVALGDGRIGPLRIDDAMVFELD